MRQGVGRRRTHTPARDEVQQRAADSARKDQSPSSSHRASQPEVARELVLSINTVEYHLKNIYAKLGISSRSQLTLRFGVQIANAHGSTSS